MKTILILKDDYNSYLTLMGCVMQKRPIEMILQIESKEGIRGDLIFELNEWLEMKGYPTIGAGFSTIDVIDRIEWVRGTYYQSFPKEVFFEIEKSNGLLAQCKKDDLTLISCIDAWNWESDEVADMVMHFSDLPQKARDLIRRVPVRPVTAA